MTPRGHLLPWLRLSSMLYRLPVWFVPLLWEWPRLPDRHSRDSRFGARLRGFASDMGAAHAKFGQFLSARYDLLPRAVCEELAGLLDDSPPVPFSRLATEIERSLGRPLAEAFASIDPEPLATGSLAQVHRARSHDGQPLAVKALRPRIREDMLADTALMLRIVKLLVLLLPGHGIRTLSDVVTEFAGQLVGELDLDRERDAMIDFQDKLGPGCIAPRPLPAMSSRDVLTMTRCDGLPFTAITGSQSVRAAARLRATAPGETLDSVARRFATSCLIQFFRFGRFHGDPHPGNILVAPDGDLVFLDFGLAGDLSSADREAMTRYFLALMQRRTRDCLPHLERMLIFERPETRAAFLRSAQSVLRDWWDAANDPSLPIEHRVSAIYHQRIMALMSRRAIRMKPQFVLFWRAQMMLDAVLLAWPSKVDVPLLVREFLTAERPDLLLEPILELTRRPASSRIGRRPAPDFPRRLRIHLPERLPARLYFRAALAGSIGLSLLCLILAAMAGTA